jgi:hypothetical protein
VRCEVLCSVGFPVSRAATLLSVGRAQYLEGGLLSPTAGAVRDVPHPHDLDRRLGRALHQEVDLLGADLVGPYLPQPEGGVVVDERVGVFALLYKWRRRMR